MSVDSENLSSKFGGTWIAWGSGRVPVGASALNEEFDTVAKTGGTKTHMMDISEIPSHKHTVSDNFGNATNLVSGTATTDIVASCGISPTTRSLTVTNTGGGGSHNNLQPYITCYMWKRTV